MPFIIPNATDTVSGQKYVAVDQSEPDSLDFQILGTQSSGVLYGCEVTAQPSPNLTVQVASGYIVLNGVAYAITGSDSLAATSNPALNRFDVVIARVLEEVVTIKVIKGSESSTNPTFPRTVNRLVSPPIGPSDDYINTSTDVVLAAVYRAGGTAITSGHIVDKRIFVRGSIPLRGTGAPDAGIGSDGDLYFQKVVSGSSASGVYVKRSGSWSQLGTAAVEPGVPVGTIIMWPGTAGASTNPNASVWMEADGRSLSTTTYSALYSVLGTTYGGSGGSFNIPDFRGHYLAGLPATGSRTLGTAYGNASNAVQVSVNNLPAHSHSVNLPTSEVTNHQHTIEHGHVGGTSSDNVGTHTHAYSGTTSASTVQTRQGDETGTGVGYRVTNKSSETTATTNNVPHTHTYSGTTDPEVSRHTHTFSVGAVTGGGLSGVGGAHGHTVTGTTQNTGGGQALSIEPRTYHIRYFIRYA